MMFHVRSILALIFTWLSVYSSGQTQAELNKQAREKFENSEKQMTKVYEQILENYKTDTLFIKNLTEAQELWKKFRTAELQARFPSREPSFYGSSHGMCIHYYLTELTEERLKKLNVWLTGEEEGDACSGSIK